MHVMKKFLFLLLACCPLLCAAQSEWETPESMKAAESAKKVNSTGKMDNKENDGNNKNNVTEIKDWEYIKEGAVPEKDGKVVFDFGIQLPGKTSQQVFDATYTALDSLAHTSTQISSGIALINRKEHIIVAKCQEWLVFSKNFLSLDQTKFNYVIVASCTDNHLDLTIERMSYNYEEGRSTGFRTSAEKWISDKYAVNKKRTKLTAGPAKFRKKTIDRTKEIAKYIEEKIKEQF